MNRRLHSSFLLLALSACDAASSVKTTELSADPRYEIRISESQLGANGHTKREVFVFGTKADGTYSTEAVVLSVDRAAAGSFTKTALTLGPLGATTYFTPCDQAAAGCIGPAHLQVALASAPTTVLASVAIDLVVPTHVSSAAPCRGPGNYVFLDGNGGLRDGMLRIDEITPPYVEVNTAANPQEVQLHFTPVKMTQGNGWMIWVDTYSMNGATLAPGVYLDAQRSHFAAAGHPGLDVSGNSRACNTGGAFEIHELVITAGALSRATISFEQTCNSGATLIEGCFRYEK